MPKRLCGHGLLFVLAALSAACQSAASPASTQLATLTVAPAATITDSPTAAPSPTLVPTLPAPTASATALPSPTTTATPAPFTRAVVVIVIDGARWTETLGDPEAAFVPHLARDLAPMGAINTAFTNEGATVSVPGHAALLTGTWQNIPNDGSTRPTMPTIFEYFRQAAGASEAEAVFVHGSFIEPVLTYSTHPEYGPSFGAEMFFSDEPNPPYDDGMWANARRVLAEQHPRLLVISLLDPDEAGHLNQWDAYRAAIQHDDEIIWDLWQQLQADGLYAGHTTLMVTSDHGRGCGAAWPNHGSGDECNRHILFLAVGPEIPPGQVETAGRTLIGIAPTIGVLLGFGTPFAEGQAMMELFDR